MSDKKWSLALLALICVSLVLLGGVTAVIDPFFHYHKPLQGLAYPFQTQRYVNDGISRNFDYTALITGSSMTENTRASECDALFGVETVKVCYSGASLKEIGDNLRRALEANPDLEMIICGMDGVQLLRDKDYLSYDDYPTYLTDDALFNDTNYLFNKTILIDETLGVLRFTGNGGETTNFDDYSNWMVNGYSFGKEAVTAVYSRPEMQPSEGPLTEAERTMVEENVRQNILSLAQEYPDVTFYCFIPPYSIYEWNRVYCLGQLEKRIEAHRITTQLMLTADNVRFYSFYDVPDLFTNPDLYKDLQHYHEDINSKMLQWMHIGEYRLTPENHDAHWDRLYETVTAFDYDTIY